MYNWYSYTNWHMLYIVVLYLKYWQYRLLPLTYTIYIHNQAIGNWTIQSYLLPFSNKNTQTNDIPLHYQLFSRLPNFQFGYIDKNIFIRNKVAEQTVYSNSHHEHEDLYTKEEEKSTFCQECPSQKVWIEPGSFPKIQSQTQTAGLDSDPSILHEFFVDEPKKNLSEKDKPRFLARIYSIKLLLNKANLCVVGWIWQNVT